MSTTDYDYWEHHDTIKGISAEQDLWDQIIAEIESLLVDCSIAYFTARDIATEHDTKSVSRCITKLCECEEYPHDLSIWSGTANPPRTYKVERDEQ